MRVSLMRGWPPRGPRPVTAPDGRSGSARTIAALLGLPGDIRQGALIPTAYHTGDTFRPAARRPLADVLHVDHW